MKFYGQILKSRGWRTTWTLHALSPICMWAYGHPICAYSFSNTDRCF